jgi:hypothetical protein
VAACGRIRTWVSSATRSPLPTSTGICWTSSATSSGGRATTRWSSPTGSPASASPTTGAGTRAHTRQAAAPGVPLELQAVRAGRPRSGPGNVGWLHRSLSRPLPWPEPRRDTGPDWEVCPCAPDERGDALAGAALREQRGLAARALLLAARTWPAAGDPTAQDLSGLGMVRISSLTAAVAAQALVIVALVAPASAGPSGSAGQSDEYCCADDQNVRGGYSTELNLLVLEWGWPVGDERSLDACGVLGGETVDPGGRVDTEPGFDIPLEPCRAGRGAHNSRVDVKYAQIRFLCTSRYPCGGARFILSRAIRIQRTGLPPPLSACRVPRVIGLRLAAARARIHRANCAVGGVRRVRTGQIGRIVAQRPSAGSRRRGGFPVRVTVGIR